MPNAPHNDRTRHGWTAPTFTVKPCPFCQSTRQGTSSGPRPSTIWVTCGGCHQRYVQESDQLIAATLATQGSQSAA